MLRRDPNWREPTRKISRLRPVGSISIVIEMRRCAALLPLIFFGFGSCDFNVGAHVDLGTGLETSNSGMGFSESRVEISHQPFKGGKIYCGETVEVQFHGVSGLTVSDRQVYPELNIVVTDQSGAKLVTADNLYQGRGYSPESAKVLTATLKVNEKFAGEDCKFHMHFLDTKGKGRIDAVLPLKIEALNTPELKVRENGLTASQKGIMSDYGRVINGEAPLGGQIGLLLYDLTGFKEIDGKVFPGAKIEIDSPETGAAIYQSEDLFAKPESDISAEQAKTMRLYLTPEKSETGKQYLWKFSVWDKKGPATLSAEILLKFR
jgi:hypothetical protein